MNYKWFEDDWYNLDFFEEDKFYLKDSDGNRSQIFDDLDDALNLLYGNNDYCCCYSYNSETDIMRIDFTKEYAREYVKALELSRWYETW